MELFSAPSFFFFVILFISLYLLFLTSTRKPVKKGFKIYPLVGTFPDLLKNRRRFLDRTTEVLRDCPTKTAVFALPGKFRDIITANPDNVEHILKTNFENYPKGDLPTTILEDFLGRGIFNSDGELWKFQRKTARYEFNTKSLRNFITEKVTAKIQMRLLPILQRASDTHQVLDLQDILERFAFDNVCKLAFSADPGYLGGDGTAKAEFMMAFDDASRLSFERFLYPFPLFWKIQRWLKLGTEQRLRESITSIHEFVDEMIKLRMERNQDEDLLSWFIGKEESSPELLRDIAISFIVAGRDTTSSALSWFFWIISTRPDVKLEIRNELKAIRVRNKKIAEEPYGYEELREMQYLHAAISETMRLYPPVPMVMRGCLKDDVLPDGTVIRKGWYISYHAYGMGRIEGVWGKDCWEF